MLGVNRLAHRVLVAHRRSSASNDELLSEAIRELLSKLLSVWGGAASVSPPMYLVASGAPNGIRTRATALKGRSPLERNASSLEGKPSVHVRRCLPRAALTVVKTVVSRTSADPPAVAKLSPADFDSRPRPM